RDAVAAELEGRRRDVRDAEAGASEQMPARHAAAVQVELGEHRRARAVHAADRHDREPGRLALDEEGGGLTRDLGENEEKVGNLAESRPLLVPGEHEALAVLFRPGFDRRGVAADARLRERERAEPLAARDS